MSWILYHEELWTNNWKPDQKVSRELISIFGPIFIEERLPIFEEPLYLRKSRHLLPPRLSFDLRTIIRGRRLKMKVLRSSAPKIEDRGSSFFGDENRRKGVSSKMKVLRRWWIRKRIFEDAPSAKNPPIFEEPPSSIFASEEWVTLPLLSIFRAESWIEDHCRVQNPEIPRAGRRRTAGRQSRTGRRRVDSTRK